MNLSTPRLLQGRVAAGLGHWVWGLSVPWGKGSTENTAGATRCPLCQLEARGVFHHLKPKVCLISEISEISLPDLQQWQHQAVCLGCHQG